MAQAQVEPLGVRCGGGLTIWRSTNAARINRDASAWAVPDAFAAWNSTVVTVVLLDLDGVVGPLKSVVQDAPDEAAPAVRRNLKLIRHPASNVSDELSASRLVTLADYEGNNKFGLLARCQEGVKIPRDVRVSLVALIGNEGPTFINLQRFSGQIVEPGVKECGAMLASRLENVEYGLFLHAAQACRGAHAQALAEHFDHLHRLVGFRADTGQGALFTKGLPALQALESTHHAVAVSKTAKSFGIAIAANTRHLTLSRRGHKVTAYRKIQQLWASTPFVAALRCYQHRGAFVLLLKCRYRISPDFLKSQFVVSRPLFLEPGCKVTHECAGWIKNIHRLGFVVISGDMHG